MFFKYFLFVKKKNANKKRFAIKYWSSQRGWKEEKVYFPHLYSAQSVFQRPTLENDFSSCAAEMLTKTEAKIPAWSATVLTYRSTYWLTLTWRVSLSVNVSAQMKACCKIPTAPRMMQASDWLAGVPEKWNAGSSDGPTTAHTERLHLVLLHAHSG